ncbi:MAG: 4-hydroxyphenylacetate 3-hydroxylase N-terminal domain-containing protein [Syntrophobacteraceae bacterium]|jgi:4-hydroxybutyryl-CoA dehydratase/vinylacetyl-CoA-Delta-isomerase
MKTGKDYIESVQAMKSEVYAFGEKAQSLIDHPCFRPTINALALTYDLAKEQSALMTAESPITGDRVNRFLHICQSPEDLIKRAQFGNFLTPLHGACVGARCAGTGALNTLYATTYEMDEKLGTDYHRRFLKFLKYAQEEDLACSGMVTDAKGDRSLGPAKQADPDVYLHVTEVRDDGIVVRGAKAHQSGAAIAHENIVVPTTTMGPDEEKFAVAFAISPDTPGIVHIAEAPAPNARRFQADERDFGNFRYGVHGSTLVVFNDVFVPRERVFMCGEYTYTGALVQRFASFQRLATAACKSGHCNLLCGAAAVAAEYNGCEKMGHIREKLTEMSFQSTLAFGSAIAAGYMASSTASGVYVPNTLMVNAAKLQAVKAVWDASQLACDIAGGVVCTAPAGKDFDNPEIAGYVEKYFKGKAEIPAKERIRIVRLVEYLVGQSSIIPTESVHGAGPSATQRLMIRAATNLDYLKRCARIMAGIEK